MNRRMAGGSREMHLVELVGPDGAPVGATTVAHAHAWPGVLHRAFSVLLFDSDDRILLQQRAATKTRFALRWGNACCGHPAPAEDAAVAAQRRLDEELGLRSVALTPAGVYVYRAGDAATGRVEYEYDHVLIGRVPAGISLRPDPDEIGDLRWMSTDELRADLIMYPARYAPWLAGVLSVWLESIVPLASVAAELRVGR